MMTQIAPATTDYAPHYAKYIQLVPDGDLLDIMASQARDYQRLLAPLSEDQGNFRYAPDKWTIKESLGHVTDAERVFTYRMLRFARADQTPLAGFEQDDYVRASNCSARKLTDLLEEFAAVRRASITLVRSLDDKAWHRRGVASGKEISVLALGFVVIGHAAHHQHLFEEKYLTALAPA
jgi:DinB superfamily